MDTAEPNEEELHFGSCVILLVIAGTASSPPAAAAGPVGIATTLPPLIQMRVLEQLSTQ